MGDNPASPHGGAQEELMARVAPFTDDDQVGRSIVAALKDALPQVATS